MFSIKPMCDFVLRSIGFFLFSSFMYYRYLRVITTCTLLVLFFNFLAVRLLTGQIAAATLTDLNDKISSDQIGERGVEHNITFTPINPLTTGTGVLVSLNWNASDSLCQLAQGSDFTLWDCHYLADDNAFLFVMDTSATNPVANVNLVLVNVSNPKIAGEYLVKVETFDLGSDGSFGGDTDTLLDQGVFKLSFN